MFTAVLKFIDKIRKKDAFVKKQSFFVDILFCDHLSVPLTKLISNYRVITPNMVTVFALFVSLIAIYFYSIGGVNNLLIGAIIFYFADVLDGIDGKLARKNNIKSEFGAKLDKYSDSLRKILAILALIYSNQTHDYTLFVGLIIVHYLMNYIKYEPNQSHLSKCHQHGLKSFFEPWDAMFLLLVIGPLFNQFFLFFVLTIILQISKIIFHKFQIKSN